MKDNGTYLSITQACAGTGICGVVVVNRFVVPGVNCVSRAEVCSRVAVYVLPYKCIRRVDSVYVF